MQHDHRWTKSFSLAFAGAAALAFSQVGLADTTGDIYSDESNGYSFYSLAENAGTGSSFTANWTYSYTSGAASGSLSLALTNTTPGESGDGGSGAITAFAFNTAAGTTLSGFSVSGGDNSWVESTPSNALGTMDTGYSVDDGDPDSWDGDGNGDTGITSGDGTVTFSWAVNGSTSTLAALSVFDFIELNEKGFGFAVRIKGFGEGGWSQTWALVPVPAALPMGLIGLCGVVVLGRRRLTRRAT